MAEQIKVLRITEWRGCPIYVLNFGRIFQYLFVFDNKIYEDHIIYKPSFLKTLLWKMRIVNLYTQEQVENAEKMILDGAVKSIDKLLNKEKSLGKT